MTDKINGWWKLPVDGIALLGYGFAATIAIYGVDQGHYSGYLVLLSWAIWLATGFVVMMIGVLIYRAANRPAPTSPRDFFIFWIMWPLTLIGLLWLGWSKFVGFLSSSLEA